ncbi:MAG: hypothetical protein ABIL50_07010 [candidate division WOR-3 bacterium]
MNRIVLNIYENLLRVRAPKPLVKNFNILEGISRYYQNYQREWDLCAIPGDRNILFINRGIIEIKEDDDVYLTTAFLGRALRNIFAPKVKGFLVLHGGAVERDGKAVLFLGGHASGKTTAVSGFCENSWGYLGEDMVMLSLNGLKVFPTPPITKSLKVHKIGAPSEIYAIFLIKFSEGRSTEIREVEPYEVLLYFTENALNPDIITPKALNTMAKLLKTTKVFRVFHSSWQDILKFCEGLF